MLFGNILCELLFEIWVIDNIVVDVGVIWCEIMVCNWDINLLVVRIVLGVWCGVVVWFFLFCIWILNLLVVVIMGLGFVVIVLVGKFG